MRKIWGIGTFKWSADFGPYSHKWTHVQVWIRLMDLPQEYRRARILFGIALGVGTPLAIDEATKNRIF